MRHLAKKERKYPIAFCAFYRQLTGHPACIGSIVVLTGITDYVSDGERVARLSNGHPLLGEITGSGCMVGTAVATFCAGASMEAKSSRAADAPEDAKLARGDMFIAAVGGCVPGPCFVICVLSPNIQSLCFLRPFSLGLGAIDSYPAGRAAHDVFVGCSLSLWHPSWPRRGPTSTEAGRSCQR